MSFSETTVSTESSSTLPLVPYIVGHPLEYSEEGTPGLFTREAADAYVDEYFACHEVAKEALASVLHENYKRRTEEAAEASKSLLDAYIVDDERTFNPELSESSMSFYIDFRQVDSEPHATLGERRDIFLSRDHPEPMKAYEIFARSRENETDFLDVSFAKRCLEMVAGSRIVTPINTPALPKLTRAIKIPPHTNSRVITTKTEVGSFQPYDDDTVVLKSRQAGLLDYDKLAPSDLEVVDYLTNYKRSLGRTSELEDARRQLQAILEDSPGAVRPVVESLYLVRPDHN